MTPRLISAALESGLPLFPVKLDKSPAVRGWNRARPASGGQGTDYSILDEIKGR